MRPFRRAGLDAVGEEVAWRASDGVLEYGHVVDCHDGLLVIELADGRTRVTPEHDPGLLAVAPPKRHSESAALADDIDLEKLQQEQQAAEDWLAAHRQRPRRSRPESAKAPSAVSFAAPARAHVAVDRVILSGPRAAQALGLAWPVPADQVSAVVRLSRVENSASGLAASRRAGLLSILPSVKLAQSSPCTANERMVEHGGSDTRFWAAEWDAAEPPQSTAAAQAWVRSTSPAHMDHTAVLLEVLMSRSRHPDRGAMEESRSMPLHVFATGAVDLESLLESAAWWWTTSSHPHSTSTAEVHHHPSVVMAIWVPLSTPADQPAGKRQSLSSGGGAAASADPWLVDTASSRPTQGLPGDTEDRDRGLLLGPVWRLGVNVMESSVAAPRLYARLKVTVPMLSRAAETSSVLVASVPRSITVRTLDDDQRLSLASAVAEDMVTDSPAVDSVPPTLRSEDDDDDAAAAAAVVILPAPAEPAAIEHLPAIGEKQGSRRDRRSPSSPSRQRGQAAPDPPAATRRAFPVLRSMPSSSSQATPSDDPRRASHSARAGSAAGSGASGRLASLQGAALMSAVQDLRMQVWARREDLRQARVVTRKASDAARQHARVAGAVQRAGLALVPADHMPAATRNPRDVATTSALAAAVGTMHRLRATGAALGAAGEDPSLWTVSTIASPSESPAARVASSALPVREARVVQLRHACASLHETLRAALVDRAAAVVRTVATWHEARSAAIDLAAVRVRVRRARRRQLWEHWRQTTASSALDDPSQGAAADAVMTSPTPLLGVTPTLESIGVSIAEATSLGLGDAAARWSWREEQERIDAAETLGRQLRVSAAARSARAALVASRTEEQQAQAASERTAIEAAIAVAATETVSTTTAAVDAGDHESVDDLEQQVSVLRQRAAELEARVQATRRRVLPIVPIEAPGVL